MLTDGSKWPNSAFAVLAKLPPELDPDTLMQVIALDRRMPKVETESQRKLSIGVIAVLARASHPQAQSYLREVFENDASRRGYAAMALAQQPDGENWPVLVSASVRSMEPSRRK